MRVHTNDFKEELKVFGRQIQGKIIYYPSYELITENGNNILTESDLQIISEQANYEDTTEINAEDIFSISIIKNGDLLQSLMKEFDFESKVELNIGSVVNPQFGLLVNGEYEYLNYGNYIIYSKEFNIDTETWSYICYDKMLFSMVKYVGIKNTTYPITLKEYINKLCNKVGLEFEDSVFVNQDQLIYEDLYKDKGLTYRDIFDEISKIVAGNLLINDDDKLEVGYAHKVGETTDVSGSSLTLTTDTEAELINFELEGKTTQETRSGKNLLNYEKLIPTGTMAKSVNNNVITLSGTGAWSRLQETLTLKENTDYTLMGYVKGTTNSNAGFLIGGLSNEPRRFNSTGVNSFIYVNFNTGSVTSVIAALFGNWSGTSKETTTVFTNVMLLEGTYTTEQEFELYGAMPSPDYPSKLKNVGYENLFVGADTTYTNGIVFIKNSDGSYNIGGTATAQANLYNFVDITEANIEDGEYYTFYVDQQLPEGVEVLAEVLNGSTWVRNVTDVLTNTRQTFTKIANLTGGTRIRYGLRVRSGYSVNIVDLKIMLIKGTIQKQYIPYGKYGVEVKTSNNETTNIYLYILDQPLRSIGNTKDLLYINKGKLYIDRKIGYIKITSSMVLNNYLNVLTNSKEARVSLTNIINIANQYNYTNLLSNCFKSINNTWGNDTIGVMSWAGSPISQIAFRIPVSDDKTFFDNHEVYLQYLLNEPYTEELGQVDMPSTYEGITYIDTTDANTPTMNVTYISEFEEIDEQYLKDTNVAVGKKFGVINSVAVLDTENNLQYLAEDTSSIKENEMTRITITDNLLALNGDTQTIADNILNKLNGLYYYINDFTTTGVCYYDFLDMFNIEARGNIYQCLLLNNEITITQGIEEHIFTEKLEESETSSNEYTTSVISNKQVQFRINQQEGRLESKVEKDGVISAINQSAEEIQINANKLSFEGATIDMTAENVKIKGKNLDIDSNGTITLNDNSAASSLSSETLHSAYIIKSEDSVIRQGTTETLRFKNEIVANGRKSVVEDNWEYEGTTGGSISGITERLYSQPQLIFYSQSKDYDITSGTGSYQALNIGLVSGITYENVNNGTTTTPLNITSTGNITCVRLTQTSKEENKKNFEKLTNAKDILNQVDIYKYNFKDEDNNVKKSIGFVIGDDFNYSQEITSENNDGANIYSMVSVLWQVVKEQQKEIEELKEMVKNGKY